MIFSAGDSRMSPTPGLYETPSTSTFDPRTERSASLSACSIFSTQKYGICALTLPASSMNSVARSYSRAFQVR